MAQQRYTIQLDIDSKNGPKTKKAFQQFLRDNGYNIAVDGLFGKGSYTTLQKFLSSEGYTLGVDGIPGPQTYTALQQFLQKSNKTKIDVDGTLGPHTITQLQIFLSRYFSPQIEDTSRLWRKSVAIQMLDDLIAIFTAKPRLTPTIDVDIDCKDAWECHSIARIGFSLDLWNEFNIVETDDIKSTNDFVFALRIFLQPFDVKHLMNDLLHVRDTHCSEKDLKYLNNGLAIPLCCDEHCSTQQRFHNNELKENDVMNHIAMLHLHFSHKNGLAQNTVDKHSVIDNQQSVQWTQTVKDEERFESILKSLSVNTLKLLYHDVLRKLDKYKDVDVLRDIFLEILGPKIDSIHADIPLTLSEEHPVKPQLMIFKGVLLPDEAHHSQKVLCDEYCSDHWQCLSMKRVAYIMERYNKMKHDIDGNDDTDDDSDFDIDAMEVDNTEQAVICRETVEQIMLYPEYSIKGFVNDYNRIKENHLRKDIKSWQWIKDELKSCKYDENDCFLCKRHCRDRDKYDGNAEDRRALFGGKCDSKDIVPCHIFDEAHHFLMHCDYKEYVSPQLNDDIQSNQSKSKVTKDSKEKPQKSKNISSRKRESRFNTTFLPDNSFVFGHLFYHWKYYKDKDGYVAPSTYRYNNLKQEMLNNKLYMLGLHLWNDTLTKAIIHKYSDKGRVLIATNRGDYNFNRCIPQNLGISISHLLVILLYTNYDEPQRYFKKKGMRNHLSVIDEELHNNHCEIAHFYKLFSETILFYGQSMTETDVLYHGIGRDDLVFTSFHPQFNVPISTTASKTQAKGFFGDTGMLLSLKADKSISDRYFYCWCSDHCKEEECLFAQAQYVFIVDIKFKTKSNTGLSDSNAEKIKCMTLFQDILEGKYFTYSMPDYEQYERVMLQLIRLVTVKSGTDTESGSNIHPYIIKSFRLSYNNFQKKELQIIESEYCRLEDITQTTMEQCFNPLKEANNVFVEEFVWELLTSNIKVTSENDSVDMHCQRQFIPSGDYQYDEKFTFCLYIKIYEVGKVSVGVWIKELLLKQEQVHVEWGFKCHQTKFAVSQRTHYFKPQTADAYRSFVVSELNELLPSLDALKFTFYLKLLPK